MTKELSKSVMCICMRNGVEIWVEKERIEALITSLQRLRENKFVKIGEELINTADIVGIFTPQTMEELIRTRQGQWKDKKGNWHSKEERLCPRCGNILQPGKICGYCG